MLNNTDRQLVNRWVCFFEKSRYDPTLVTEN